MKQKVVIFGAGEAGKAALKNVKAEFVPVAVCDNDPVKVGGQLSSLPIISPIQLSEITFDLILIASEYFEQITEQLRNDLAIPKDKIRVLSASQIKPFHFGDDDSVKNLAENVLFTVCDTLRSCGIKHHIDAGTLLGIYRDNALIPWDDDLDIAIPNEMVESIRKNKHKVLENLHLVTQTEWQLTEYYAKAAFGLVPKGAIRSFKLAPVSANNESASQPLPLIDLFVKYLGDTSMDYVIASRGFSMSAEHMQHLASHSFKGKRLSIPSNVEGYLTNHYGDWQTPNPDWSLDNIRCATVFQRQTA